jgi:hypothetical protein
MTQVIRKASKVAEALTCELRKIRMGSFDNPRFTYRDADGSRKRGVLIKDPVANLHWSGAWITVNYAPYRDEGMRLSIGDARRYLLWLQEGGNAPHWIFLEETGDVRAVRPELELHTR